ncbi:DNA-binding FadR family transcriptional regulator [Sphingomonas jinjuensis]|uniref:DNA-binding FadR family transcriptional regulator n=1 Tax=Sphingomonas jinjuensis TaxID=535907 RepID=A0A840F4W5_9SPHN|nr:FadR/GntR family transcriptional regulator [Sphingomonas jinjuensis]MBB4154343.1 DNA-binding FadR family transcriptional regulator [Sphingomonas jinjuensis]
MLNPYEEVSDHRVDADARKSGRRLRGAVAQHLGRAIVTGIFQPGDIMPGEVAHAEALAVSRGAYREAIQTLIAKGLVESKPKAGTRVQPRHRWNLLDPDVLDWAFAAIPDQRLVRSLFELREAIEPVAARLAAERRTKPELRTMREALATMTRLTIGTEAGQQADREFHVSILHASQNDALIALAPSISASIRLTTRLRQRELTMPRDSIPDHRSVYDAIADGDSAAATVAMTTLIRNALKDLQERVLVR